MQRLELDRSINDRLGLLKVHLPYHESDHVLNIAYNLLAGGARLEHLELLRNDEGCLDAQGGNGHPFQEPMGLPSAGHLLGQCR
ncbi:MAG: hypothetical protein ACKOHG_10775 [Planctomycetia bacterium]